MTRSLLSLTLIGLSLSTSFCWAAAPRGVDLAALEGWDIVLPAEAIESETYAAEQLQHFLTKAAGRTVPIRREADGDAHHIFVGRSEAMRGANVGFDTAKMGEEF